MPRLSGILYFYRPPQSPLFALVLCLFSWVCVHVVHRSPRLVATKDSSCLRVKLDQLGSEHSWLVIKPQFMYRSVGDCVEIGDQLSLHFKSHDKKVCRVIGRTYAVLEIPLPF